jgi:hypothetical protein
MRKRKSKWIFKCGTQSRHHCRHNHLLPCLTFSPVLLTWCDTTYAGRFTIWPGLSSEQVRLHPSPFITMHMCHLYQQRFTVRSTQLHPSTPTKIETTPDDSLDKQHDAVTQILNPPAHKSHSIYTDCQEFTGPLYTDPTNRFLQTSTSGNTTVLITFEYDMSYVHAEPMQNKSGTHILAAHTGVHTMISTRGLNP